MGAQSIKIPVELELRQLQGSIQTLKNALEKVKPGTKVYENLSKSLDKIEHQFYSLENASKKSFKNVGEINAFEKAFEKVANSISDVASDFKRLNFEDLSSDLFSKDDIQRIQEASNKIKKVQTDIDNLRSDKFKEVASSSDEIKKAFSNLEIDIDTTNIDDAIKSIKNNLKSLSSQIGGKTRSINSKKNQLNLLETQAAAISSLKTGEGLTLAQKFGANFFDDTGKAFKDENSKQALVEMLAGLGLNKANLVKVQQSTAADLESFSDNIINTLRASAAQMKKDIEKITKTELPALEFDKQQLTSTKAQQEAALKQLTAIDPSLTAELDNYKQQLSEAKNQLVLLKQELAQVRNGTDNYTKVVDDNNNALKQVSGSLENVKEQASNVARAQEKLADIKFAIKNWFGFNEVINLTKNAVRNIITQIRELDDVMTQIAIVTDMTQQELWDQMDTYSAMAQQYGASIKGVYEVSQLYYQQGLQTAEVMNLTEETLKMAKIANLDYAEATDYMTVALRGFKLEMSDAQQVTDVYSALAAATASDTEELAVAMSKTASSAEAVGSSFESTSAMIATMISITREAPENIGSALKSIISRYGEMTSDPMKLVDSEGEEMSLNKVDKALQSVGISLQDAQGQFRDFDDVILELSKSWDTIDTNTQRYIATVMAGNRQQSRFLALVGNYEEYAKALEVAENAEDAGTLQTLKTMDSISTKWEQLKVSLQEFYTSAGLEDVFKGVLDALTAFLTKANDIPKLFGKIPVSVIALVSSLITSIKNVATSLTTSLMGPISEFNSKLDELAKKNIEIKVKAVPETGSGTQARQVLENEAKQGGPITTNKNKTNILDKYNKEELQAIQNFLKTDRTNDDLSNLMINLRDTSDETINYVNSLQELSKSQTYGVLFDIDRAMENLTKSAKKNSNQVSIFNKSWKAIGDFGAKNAGSISLVTSALSALALTLKDSSSAGVEWSKTLSGGLNSVVGAVLGFASGQWQYAIPMLISGIPTLIDGIIYTTEEKLKNATEKATELNNTALQRKSEHRDLKNEIKELENLTEARHDNSEAYQEWLDYNNQMASSYPELISYIDSEGNAIIDLAASYETLETARLAAAKASTEAVGATIEQAEISAQNAQERVGKAIDFNYTPELITADENIINTRDYFLNNSNKLYSAVMSSDQADLLYDAENIQTDIANYLNNPQNETYLANLLGEQSESEMLQNLATVLDTNIENINGENFEQKLISILSERFEEFKEIQNAADSLLTDNTAYNNYKAEFNKLKQDSSTEAKENFLKYIGENYTELVKVQNELYSQNTDVATDAANQIQTYLDAYKEYNAALTQQALTDKQLEASYRQGIATFAYYDNELSTAEIGEELTNFNELVTDFMVRRWKQSGKDIDTYLQSQESLDYQEFESAFEEIWESLSSSQQTALNELLVSGEDYDFNDYKAALADFGITQGIIYDELTRQWIEDYRSSYNNFWAAIGNRQSKSLAEDKTYIARGIEKLRNLAPKYYDEILDFYDKVNLQISDGLISQLQGNDILDAYSSLWQQSKGLENEAEIQKILAEGDFTSLTGIYEVRDALEKAGMDANDILTKLADTIHVNLTTEWDSYFSTVTTKIGELEESLNKATEGMSLEEAQSLTEKLEGVTLSDFDIKDGEFIFKNVEQINQYYTSYFDDLKDDLTSKTEDLESVKNALEIGTATVTKNGIDYTQDDLPAITEALEKANDASTILDDYKNQLIGNTLIQLGQISQFLDHLGLSGEIRNTAKNAILTGDTDKIAQLFPDYSKALIDTFQNITKDTYSSVVDSITSGEVIEVTEANRAILESFGNGVKIINDKFASVSAENIDSIIATISSSNLKLTDKNELLQSIYDSQEKFDKNQAFSEVIENLDSISSEAVTALANSLGLTFDVVGNWFSENADGTFTTSLSNIVSKFNEFGDGFSAEVQDAINEYLDNILGIVSNGISGSMTNVEFETLSNFMGLDLDFTETAEGLKLTKASAIEVYTELKKIDSIQAQITFSDLAESLEEAGSGYEDVASTMKTIAELNRELADVPVSSERRAELERELAVAEEILRVRSQDPDSFNFMDKDLPTGMQGPENYWNSVGEAYKVMNESAKSGYMEIQDYVNTITHMSQMVEAAGGEFSIKGYNAAQLIEMGMGALSNIDGEGVKVNLENLGIDILGGTEGMTEGFDDAIKEMARSQIEMLDAAIKMLETIVAMEELGDIDVDSDNQIELGEIFNLDENNKTIGFTEKYAESLVHIRNALVKAGIDLNQVTIGTHTLNDLLTTSYSEWKTFSITAEQQQQLINGLYQAVLSDDWDPNNISSIFSTWAQTIGESFAMHNEQVSIKVSDTGEIFAINWEDPNLEEKIKTAGFESKEQAQELVKKYINSASDETIEITSEDLYKIHILSGEITVTKDEDGETYHYNGQEYKDLNELKAILYAEEQTGHIGGEIIELPDGTIGVKQIIKVGNNEVTVVTSDGGTPEYTTDNGSKGATLEEAIANEYRTNGIRSNGVLIESQEDYEYRMGYKVKPVVTFPETFDTSDPTTRSSVTEFLSKGTAGIEQAIAEAQSNGDGTKTITIGDNLTFTVAEGATAAEIEAQIMQEMGIDQLQFESLTTAITTAITNAFSGETGQAIGTAISTGLTTALGGEQNIDGIPIGELTLKPKGLKVDTSEAGEPTLSSGEEALSNVPITSLTLTPETLYIDIVNKTPQLKEGQTVTIENIPSATGTVTGSITITNNGTWSAAEGQTSPEVTGYTSANGTVETVTINGSSFKVTPVAGAPTNLDGELNPIESGFVKVEGNYYSVDLSSGTQLNPGMDLSGVTAGSAQVNATSYTVTFTNANGTTSQSVIVQGEAQLNAVLQNATLGDNGGWTLSGISAEVDASISAKSENALVNFFDTLVNKLKNIEVTYQEPTLVGPGPDTSTPGYYVSGLDNNSGNIAPIGQYSKLDASAVEDITAQVDNGTFQNGTFTITEMRADGTQLTTTATLAELQAGTVNFSGASPTPTPSGPQGEKGRGGNSSGGGATPTALPPIDTSAMMASIQTAADSIGTRLGNAGQTGGAKAASAIQKTLDGIKSKTVSIHVDYPKNVSIGVNYSISVNVSVSGNNVTSATGRITGGSGISSFGKNSASGHANAKGRIGTALASGTKKTLMGELGPELVVSNGRYFVVGQNGAEFVDLADDAIVFNHLQTDKLIKHGHAGTGKPVTNETKAVSLATGNVSGPAMASASEALAQLRQIRAMWQAMLDASAQDLGSKAGSGGGGGGGGGGSGEDIKAVTGELERWYNLLRQIDSLEQHITLEQAKRANMLSGYNHVDSLEKELKMLKEQQKAYKLLSDLQKDYYDRRREDLLSTDYSKIFIYTEHGLMQYVDGENRGLDVLAKLNERDASGKLVNHAKNAKTQIAYLKSIGFDTSILKNNEDGTKAENEEGMMENFWAGVDGWMEELDGLYDSYHEAITNFEESTEKMNEILQEYIDNQLSVEQKLLQAIQDREQAEIDRIQDEKDALEEAAQSYIDGLNDALSKEQDMYSRNETNAETQKLQRQLAILQRSGGSTSEIKSLQDQIDSRLKDAYFQEQQDQIDAIQQASDNQLEKLQNQIDIMTESLEYQKEHGLLWNEVYEMMNQWTPEQMLQFIEEYTKSYQENSALQNEEDSKETLKELEIYAGKRDLDKREAGWAEYYANAKYDEALKQEHSASAKQAYDEAFATGGASAGEVAANKVYDKALADKAAAEEEKKRKEEEATAKKEQEPIKVTQNGSLSGGQMNVRSSASAKSKSKGIVKSGKTFTAVGYKNGWLKVENAKSTNGTVSGYMKYTNYKKYYRGIDITKLPSYSKGGDIDFTGLAMVHGSKNSPENILSAEHTKLLRQGIFSNSNHSLAATVEAIQELARNMVSSVGANETGINIEQLSVNIQPGVISNDYDARRAGEMALEEMVRIARKTTNRVVSR